MKRVLMLLALSADHLSSLNAENIFKDIDGENIIAQAANKQIDKDLADTNTSTTTHNAIPTDLSLSEYSTTRTNDFMVGQTFNIQINGSIGANIEITFDKDGYFSDKERDENQKAMPGRATVYHYTALKPGMVKVTAQQTFRGNNQGQPQTYTFNIQENHVTLKSDQNLINITQKNNINNQQETFLPSIGLTVEASEEQANKNNMASIIDETSAIEDYKN